MYNPRFLPQIERFREDLARKDSMSGPRVNAVDEMNDLATRLEAIATWQNDQVQCETGTGRMLGRSAFWLRKAASMSCGQGYIGCRGGHDCTSDHK